MELFWYKNRNFGDLLTPYIFSAFNIPVSHRRAPYARVFGIGSVMESTTKMISGRGVVWTSGCMYKDTDLDLSRFYVLGVRGYLTRQLCHLPEDIMVGDGGLLAKEVFEKRGHQLPDEKPYHLGIIPHFVDLDFIQNRCALSKQFGVKVISVIKPHDVSDDEFIDSVIYQAAQCQHIISSSLHGLILADSLNIPNRRFVCPTSKEIKGKGFKYWDYYSVFYTSDINMDSLAVNETSNNVQGFIKACFPYQREEIERIKDRLVGSLQDVVEAYVESGGENVKIKDSNKIDGIREIKESKETTNNILLRNRRKKETNPKTRKRNVIRRKPTSYSQRHKKPVLAKRKNMILIYS